MNTTLNWQLILFNTKLFHNFIKISTQTWKLLIFIFQIQWCYLFTRLNGFFKLYLKRWTYFILTIKSSLYIWWFFNFCLIIQIHSSHHLIVQWNETRPFTSRICFQLTSENGNLIYLTHSLSPICLSLPVCLCLSFSQWSLFY